MSSFTSNLGLLIMTPGDPSVANIWGANLNNSVFDLLDSAVAGMLNLSVAGSSNVVLTNTNGAADQERNAIFNFTGALTGNIDVLLPSGKTKVFVAKNSTTGAFTLSLGVNNGSGLPAGTTVAVLAGTSGVYYSDGTNIVSAQSNSFSTLTVTTSLTAPDSGVWGTGGIRNLTALGIGMSPTNILDITQNGNVTSRAAILNPNAGASVAAEFESGNGSSVLSTGILGTGFSSSGIFRADGAYIQANGGGGLSLLTFGAARPIYFGVNAAEVGRFGTDGSLLVGTTTNQGAGSIGASGTITQGVSDDRMKDRRGSVRWPILKVMRLSAFYFDHSDMARRLGMDTNRHVGLSAQEMIRIMPEVVSIAPINSKARELKLPIDGDLLTIQYEKVVPLLVQAIKTLVVACGVSLAISIGCVAMLLWR